MGGITTWTAEQIEELSRLWANDDSASVIGAKMGFTRNAILGKAHRLKLDPRTKRNGCYYGKPDRETTVRRAPKRIYRNSVFKSAEIKPEVKLPSGRPALAPVMSPITGAFIRSARRRPTEPEYTKDQLRAQLAQAVANTARLA